MTEKAGKDLLEIEELLLTLVQEGTTNHMKITRLAFAIHRALLLCVATTIGLALPRSTFAQGTLTPPGAPAQTMKTLDQVEPRKPISSLPFTITQPGSYYVTSNLVGVAASRGITV